MPFDDLADDEQSDAPNSGSAVCRGELLGVPQHDYLDYRDVRSQHDGLGADGLSSTGPGRKSCGVYRLPRGKQLHLHRREYRLLRLPPTGLAEHANARRRCTESHRGGLPDLTLLHVPHDAFVDFNF